VYLLCVGDVALAEEGLSQWAFPGGATPGEHARILFNWELPIGDTINPIPRSSGPRLLAHPSSLRVIEGWATGFATLATNHILDAGPEGLVNTIESLNHLGFATVGAGRSREETERALFWETDEGRLAILNWVFPETHPDWMAVPGPNCWPGPDEAKKAVEKVRGEADWVMVVAHWSDEIFPYPRREDRATAQELAQMGADLVVGHHPHVVRGMETIGSCPVFYSIGNFYFSDIADRRGGWISQEAPRNREGLGVQISFQRGKRPGYQALSFWNTKSRVVLDPSCRAVRRMDWVSRPLRQFQNSGYPDWYAVERARFDKWDGRWHFGVLRRGLGGTLRYLWQKSRSHLRGNCQGQMG
jgi:hypothetical protein